ncbi:MAG: hypothetical protein M1838_001291 [Thelocarpon superellum]|nr:MAG: hypothetical protein M1838_001291 [Thelocarpon superellum]
MAQVILSINAGSSSVKISVYKTHDHGQDPTQLAETQVAGLTAPPSTFSYMRGSRRIKGQKLETRITSQDEAFRFLLDRLVEDEGLDDIGTRRDITVACHRIVHGGDYADAQVIDSDTYHHLEELTDLAPLHNASALAIIRSCMQELPSTRNLAFFDSAFHQTIPDYVRTYAIDPATAQKNKLRKYGFHGISYAFILRSAAHFLGQKEEDTSIIALHLGSGASACAIRQGKSLDTSMGLTPLAGLPGATRSGDVDPSLVFHFTHDAGKLSPSSTKEMHISTAEEILNKQSGWKALTGTTDFGKIASSDDASCRLTVDIFVDRIVGFIGSYFVKLDGKVDALVFAGGIGEKSALVRGKVMAKCRSLGFELDAHNNDAPADEVVADIGHVGAARRSLVCQTDEQAVIVAESEENVEEGVYGEGDAGDEGEETVGALASSFCGIGRARDGVGHEGFMAADG